MLALRADADRPLARSMRIRKRARGRLNEGAKPIRRQTRFWPSFTSVWQSHSFISIWHPRVYGSTSRARKKEENDYHTIRCHRFCFEREKGRKAPATCFLFCSSTWSYGVHYVHGFHACTYAQLRNVGHVRRIRQNGAMHDVSRISCQPLFLVMYRGGQKGGWPA